MDWTGISSRRLAFGLQLGDVEELRSNQTANPLKRKAADFDFALEVYRGDLRDAICLIGDGIPALTAAPITAPDSRLIKRPASNVPKTDEAPDNKSLGLFPEDENLGLFLGSGASRAVASVPLPPMTASNEEENSEKPDGGATLAEGANTLRCISCGDEHSNVTAAQAPCGHLWCAGCLGRFFGRATVDEGMFPPQCCTQPIPLTDVSKWLPAELVTEFEEKQIEFTTPKRLYCANKRCSAFILPDNIAIDRGSCKVCGRATCTICKAAGHKGICSRDPARRRTMALAKRERWQKCYGCKTVVELDSGCNHISE